MPQFVRGARIIGEFCKRNSEAQIRVKDRAVYLKLNTYEETQRRMRLVDALLEVGSSFKERKWDRSQLVIRTVRDDESLKTMLRQELSPPVAFFVMVGMCVGSDA